MRLSKSILDKQELKAVKKILLDDGYLGMGKEVQYFENDLANYLSIDPTNVVCVNSGTAALHLAIESILNPGDEILVPSFTFLSSYQAISAARVIPISCEINEEDWLLNLDYASSKITKKTKAIMYVHYGSQFGDLKKVYDFAAKYNLRVIEDAAHSFGCSHKNKKIGSFGDIICFSFDGIKNITSGEGGAIVTSDEKVLQYVKDARLLSVEKDSEKRYNGIRSWEFDVKNQGYRYHLSNIFAAIGRVQLKKLDIIFKPKRIKIFERYKELLSVNDNIIFQASNTEDDIIPHILPIRIVNNKRDFIKSILEINNIPTGIHYKPNHLLSYYKKPNLQLKITEQLYTEILTLPLHPEIKLKDVERICKIILKNI